MLTKKESRIREPILTSILDQDLYKVSMGSVVFHLFPRAQVTYTFINRGKTPFPDGFAAALNWQIELMGAMGLDWKERNYLDTIPYLRPTYVEWLYGYKYDPNEVVVTQDDDGQIQIQIKGPWYRTIFWEVPLMAIISQLYFEMTGQNPDKSFESAMNLKGMKLSDSGCHWIDFGTRRRFSYDIQDALVRNMINYKGFLGTSNIHFAHKYGVPAHGTFAHEYVMGMQALYGDFITANKMAMKHWSDHYDGLLGAALTDTFTTKTFLSSFGPYEARLFDGVRQDSGDPYAWGNLMLNHYKKLNIPTNNKRFIFSDALTTEKYIKLDQTFRPHCQPIGGIGTHFTNDVGDHVKPLNIVIKLSKADFGNGPVDVIKLSDDVSKATGKAEKVEEAKKKLNILCGLKLHD